MITIKEAEEILKKEYHIDNFSYLVGEILLPDYSEDKHDVAFDNSLFSSVTMLGESKQCDVTVFEVIVNEGYQNRRVGITQEMFRILRGLHINNALVVFANSDKRNYRISLLTSKYEFDGDKIVKVLSNPRRYSYSLGYGTKTKTAYKFLIEKGKVANLDELISRFSVEVVNKQFYTEIATAFTELVGGERNGRTYDKLMNIYGVTDQNKYAEFGVRLIGRIMFCWFLREKKSENGSSLVPGDMLTLDGIGKSNYYHNVLEPLFFELLNTNQKRRKREFQTEYYAQVPYLNGGLFSPHEDDHYSYNAALQCGSYGIVTIPNEWFVRLYSVLGEYNFTVDENTAYDIELSIDPEMLGRIFENLLAEINPETGENAKKSTGSFYTPRDIVDYMVDSSLCEYLKTKTGIAEEKLRALISYSKEDDELAVFDPTEKKKLINALYTITVLDPACGSGAFPIGMLQKVVYMLQELDPDAGLWFDKATENAPLLLKREFEKKFNAGSLNYIRKLCVIQNSIFGIDIQPIAVEISRLRCFLSLIIEEKVDDNEENRGINPLPNLDFKFIIANSLMKLPDESMTNKTVTPEQLSVFENQDHISQLKAVREEYFSAESDRRTELKLEFAEIQKQMFQETISNFNKQASNRYKALSDWSPFNNQATDWFDPEWMFGVKDGFDVVIGNPPYLESRNSSFSDLLKDRLQAQLVGFYGERFSQIPRGSDLLVYFFELSLRLISKDGINVFITQNSWLDTEYGAKFQHFLIEHCKEISILDSDYKAFETANINTVISFFKGKGSCCKDIVLAKQHIPYGDYHFSVDIDKDCDNENITVKLFSPDDDLIRSYKWGFLFNCESSFLSLISELNKYGKKESALPWLKIGQGLNITKDYAVTASQININIDTLIPYLNVDECGYYDWNKSSTYLISNKKISPERVQYWKKVGVQVFDEKTSKREKPSLILPRGIGAKHFCSMNSCNGYSASCVDFYISSNNKSYANDLWLFLNSTLFWLIREISGRKSLGGGMLKSEAVDLKQFPVFFKFDCDNEIEALIRESNGYKVENAVDELNSALHQKIDNLVFQKLNIPPSMQKYIYVEFEKAFRARYSKSLT